MDLLADAVWELAGTGPGTLSGPVEASAADLAWIRAEVPGTVAGALRDAGQQVPDSATVDSTDWWLRTTAHPTGMPTVLVLDGLATVADVWVAGRHVLHSENMFRSHIVDVPALNGQVEIVVRCAAPLPTLGRRPRPRWKSTLVGEQRWRWLRTTVLGRISSWAGPIAPAGIWRPVRLLTLDEPVLISHRLTPELADGRGVVRVEVDVRGAASHVGARAGSVSGALERGADGRWRGVLDLGAVEPWWPHTHGAQPLTAVQLIIDEVTVPLGQVGFRTVEADTADGGFALRVNGVAVFARGACWEPLDPVTFAADPEQVRTALRRLRDPGHNLVRVPGTGVYETDDFYAACDELGLLVWQDCMLTTLDPPQTDEFADELTAEITEVAGRLAAHPCVAVVCGGAETEQQPVMLGLPTQPIRALTETIPHVLAQHLPYVPYVTGTPSGGALPVHTGSGIAQYFGVGAYLRPVADVRSAGVRFAGESLAFSVPPEHDSVLAFFGSARVAGHDPRWKRAVPRDPGASWDFEDVRDHYVAELFGVDPARVRYSDPARYLDLGRAAVCIAMTEVLSWWRRPASGCAGAVVLSARDLCPGAGWGLIDTAGRPKAPLLALRPVLATTALLIGDDAGVGISVTAVHDGPDRLEGTLDLTTWSTTGAVLDQVSVELVVPAHGSVQSSVDAAFGRFTDANHYYRFGPRSRDVLGATLRTTDGAIVASVTHLLGHHLRPVADVLRAGVIRTADGWDLLLEATGVVQWLAIDSPTHLPCDSWFHLAPGETRWVRLSAMDPARDRGTVPQVSVRALNVTERVAAATDPGGDA